MLEWVDMNKDPICHVRIVMWTLVLLGLAVLLLLLVEMPTAEAETANIEGNVYYSDGLTPVNEQQGGTSYNRYS